MNQSLYLSRNLVHAHQQYSNGKESHVLTQTEECQHQLWLLSVSRASDPNFK